MTATLSARGQLVIPAAIRRNRHLKAGTKIKFVDTGSAIVLVPIPKDPFKAAYGSLKGIVRSADLIALRRQERRGEHARYRRLGHPR